ncbi:DUF4011 domain-containing protein [Bradymonas sediminis]|uniref:Uncharacterized protein n=1 Tax=Bradymonas sediminis TaxID=1548548 RepID=A0A2Z4FJK7_9DELT|nr:DUF4011 domain-containing protein [Bradymonas sediminis]AWV89005.1 hypothetical protein DN745_06485 [Bradymonas sediminis]TDP72020.1 uncharacterized protein DUF3320 [Bradymonas sediminis]
MQTRQFRWKGVELSIEYGGVVNYALQQNRMPVISALRLENKGEERVEDLRVAISSTRADVQGWETHLATLEPGYIWNEPGVDLAFPAEALASLSERIETELCIKISHNTDGDTVEQQQFLLPIAWLAYNEWPGVGALPQLLSAFVLPNHPDLVDMVARMRDILERWSGDATLSGYQDGDPARVRKVAASAYGALQELGFSYINPPASFETAGQKIRTPEQLFNGRMGTCLDVTLLVAAALESVGLHPVLVLVHGHIFVGVWLQDEAFADPIIDDPAQLRKRAKLGQILFFDPTVAVSGKGADFARAQDDAMAQLSDFARFVLAIDVRASRQRGVRPIAARVFGEDGKVRILEHSEREDRARAVAPKEENRHADLDAREREHLARIKAMEGAQLGNDELQRLDRWCAKLLDLSLRNPLLNFRHTKSTAMLLHHDLAAFEDIFATGKKFRLDAKPETMGALDVSVLTGGELYRNDAELPALLDNALESSRIHTAYPSGEHAARLKTIYRDARREMQETGVNLLHLALGFLRWFDPNKPDTPRVAPLILLPVKLERLSATDRYTLEISDDEALINHSLLEKLRQEFSLEIPGLSVLPQDASGLDIALIFKQFRQAVLPLRGWDIMETAFLGVFSFGKFMMWHDLRENHARLRQNTVVRRILNPATVLADEVEAPQPEAVGTRDDFCVMDADSSQLAAVRAAASGESYVLQGPPGTGKSQTITNIIAQCLADGRNVLFVAEKRAALDVVYKRLSDVGLDDFCLRLHSENANKRAVAAQLGRALQQAGAHPSTDWAARVDELARTRRVIDEYVTRLHHERALGLSVFEAVARLTQLSKFERSEVHLEAAVQDFDAAQFARIREEVQNVGDFAADISPVASHPLRAIGTPVLDPDARRGLEKDVAKLFDALAALKRELGQLPEQVPPPEGTTIERLREHARLLESLANRPTGGRLLAATSDWDTLQPRLHASLETGLQVKESREALQARYSSDFFELELQEARRKIGQWKDAFFLVAFVMLWSLRRQVRRATVDGTLPENPQLEEDLEAALEVKQLDAELAKMVFPNELQGTLWQGEQTNWSTLHFAYQWADDYREHLRAVEQRDAWEKIAQMDYLPWESTSDQVAKYLGAVHEFERAWQGVAGAIEIDASCIEAAAASWVDGLEAVLREWKGALGDLRSWSLYLNARARVVDAGLRDLIDGLECGSYPLDALDPVAEKSLLTWWVERIFASEEQLAQFSGVTHARLLDKFRALDRETMGLARQEIRARLSAKLPQPQSASKQSEVGIVLREIQKKSRHLPIRELFGRIPTLLPRLAPCMLMSPMSVAQYLIDDPVQFDLVIFDEASQIAPWDALGAISRAAQCIVVGDSKQLPPTSFFNKTYEEDELQEVEDLESILDECVAGGLHSRRILWHYRSRDEALIAFSNYHYYDNELLSFPSAMGESNQLGVSYRHVPNGYYDKGKTRTNQAEAEAIVAEIVERLSDATRASASIGVVTFSQAQQTLIEDLLDEARGAHPAIEPYFSDAVAEPVFIKNLENVQGDERDIMLFSICYAPDREGRLSMNFGPLNRQGGERRLNVAITRARQQLIVFATLRPEQIDLSRTSAMAVGHLKTFLRYAEMGPRAISEARVRSGQTTTQRAIQQKIKAHLEAAGYDVRTDIGHSGYQVDLAVLHPAQPDFLMLGIESDGANYRRARSARDRDQTRRAVLNNLGWNLHRVWTPDWWHRSERELAAIADRLAELREQPPARLKTMTNYREPTQARSDVDALAGEAIETPPADGAAKAMLAMGSDTSGDKSAGESESETQRAWADALLSADAVDYMSLANATQLTRAELPADGRKKSDFNKDANLLPIAKSAMRIIMTESPVNFSAVKRQVARHWGYSRLSERIEERIELSLANLKEGQRPLIRAGFAWSPTMSPESYRAFRPTTDSNAPRACEEIPPEEAANAAEAIVASNLSLPVDELQRQVIQVFGFSQVGSNLRELADSALEILISQNRATLEDGQVRAMQSLTTPAEG